MHVPERGLKDLGGGRGAGGTRAGDTPPSSGRTRCPCTSCGQAFSDSSASTTQERTHTGDRPYTYPFQNPHFLPERHPCIPAPIEKRP